MNIEKLFGNISDIDFKSLQINQEDNSDNVSTEPESDPETIQQFASLPFLPKNNTNKEFRLNIPDTKLEELDSFGDLSEEENINFWETKKTFSANFPTSKKSLIIQNPPKLMNLDQSINPPKLMNLDQSLKINKRSFSPPKTKVKSNNTDKTLRKAIYIDTNILKYVFKYFNSTETESKEFSPELQVILNYAYMHGKTSINYQISNTEYVLFFTTMKQISENGVIRKVIKS